VARIAVVITCFNRREKTLSCLKALFEQQGIEKVEFGVYLVDDGSTDGTVDAVRQAFPAVTLIYGDGNLFWNGGMRVAMAAAMRDEFDFYLWLNDDIYLRPHALTDLLRTHESIVRSSGRETIIVGTTCDPTSGETSYGGLVKTNWWQPLHYSRLDPDSMPKPCDTMNGNCVLIPAAVARSVGNLESAFVHSMGDWDYGYRAKALGFDIYIAPGYQGSCKNDSADREVDTRRLSLKERWKKVTSPKGFPIRAWRVYTQRHAGPLWPLYWLRPYVFTVAAGLFRGGGRR